MKSEFVFETTLQASWNPAGWNTNNSPAFNGLGTPPTKTVFLGSNGNEASSTKSASLNLQGRIWTGLSLMVGLETHKYSLSSSWMQASIKAWTDDSSWKEIKYFQFLLKIFVMVFCWLDSQMLRVSVKRARKRFRDPLVKCTVYVNNVPSTGLRDVAGLRSWVVQNVNRKKIIFSISENFNSVLPRVFCWYNLQILSTTLRNITLNRCEGKSVDPTNNCDKNQPGTAGRHILSVGNRILTLLCVANQQPKVQIF